MRDTNDIIGSGDVTRQSAAVILLLRRVLTAAAFLSAAACGSDSITGPGSGSGSESPVAVASVEVAPAEHLLEVGDSVSLQAFPKSAAGVLLSGRTVTWQSERDEVLMVSASGVATARAEGTALAVATVEGKAGQARITVRPAGTPAPAPVITSLSPAQITAGWPGQFTLTIAGENFTLGSRILLNGLTAETHYISMNELRTVIYPSAVVLPGEITVTVQTPAPGGGSAERAFPVLLRAVSRIDLTAYAGAWLWVGDTTSLNAVARDGAGNAIPHYTFDWSSSNEGVASVNANGLVTGFAKGRTEIGATARGVTATRQMSVYDAPEYDLVYDVGTNEARRIVLWTPGSMRHPISLTSTGLNYDPAPSPDGRRIAFTGVVDGNRDIYVMNRNGGGLVRLTDGASTDDEPAWSPDGTKIAFRSTRSGAVEVWVMNADGSDQRRLTGPDEGWYIGEESFNPAWSPDSRFIVYAKREPGKVNLWIMRADGTEKRRLTSATSEEHIDPAWSPDGSTITFRRSFGQQVAMQRVLAESGASLGGLVQPTFGRAPSYSPDGKWIAYTATDDQYFGALKVMPGGSEDWPRIARGVASGGGNNPSWIARR